MTNTQSTNKKNLPFGLWPSPITPEMIGQAIRLQDVQWGKDGSTLDMVPIGIRENKHSCQTGCEAPYDLTGTLNPAGGVGYGGGEFVSGSDKVIFADRDGRLYSRSFGTGSPKPITPAFGSVASPSLSPDGKWVAFVHTYEGQDVLGLVDAEGKIWPEKLTSGADFYMQPVWSPKGMPLPG